MREAREALGLPMGRPANRSKVYRGDRCEISAEGALMGPDAHGVFWRPVRSYFEATATTRWAEGETLVVFAPVHPDDLPAGVL